MKNVLPTWLVFDFTSADVAKEELSLGTLFYNGGRKIELASVIARVLGYLLLSF
jgi:hypothetical protein